MLKRIIFLTLFLAMIFVMPKISEAQIIKPTGKSTRASTQLFYFYDELITDSSIQVTNTNPTESITIHIQIFRSFDPDGDGPATPIFCDERDFFDELTPNDTHTYDMDSLNSNTGLVLPIDVSDTMGFVVITPVVSNVDASAISFQHMVGNYYRESEGFNLNSMGRDAVDFITGDPLPDGTVLDGVTGGFVILQPEEYLLDFTSSGTGNNISIYAASFIDSYGPPGLLGYTVLPGEIVLTSFIFDFAENPTSCGNVTLSCFFRIGINDTLELEDSGTLIGPQEEICPGTITPSNTENDGDPEGWLRSFLSGYDQFENTIAAYTTDENGDSGDGGKYLYTK